MPSIDTLAGPTTEAPSTGSLKLPTVTQIPSYSGTSVSLLDFVTGNCSKLEDVMTVNFEYYQSWWVYHQCGCNPVLPTDIDVAGNNYTHLTYTFASINAAFELEPRQGGDYETKVEQYKAFNGLKQVYPGL